MSIKKPSVKGLAHASYLGHFAQDKHIQAGHNTNKTPSMLDIVKDKLSNLELGKADLEIERKRREYAQASGKK